MNHSINDDHHNHSSSSLPSSSSSSSCSPETPIRIQEATAAAVESPPPTPPIRYSSLPENHLNIEKRSIHCQLPVINQHCDQQSIKMKTNFKSNDYIQHWSYDLYPKMRRKKQQQQQQLRLEENPYDNQIELSLSSPQSSKNHQYSSITSSSSSSSSSSTIPAQIVHSHRIQQVVRQETTNSLTKSSLSPSQMNSGSQTILTNSLSSPHHPLPPILPPKSYQTTTNTKNIKEIQKRAVYEFYLRQKEKKKNRINNKQQENDEEETGENCIIKNSQYQLSSCPSLSSSSLLNEMQTSTSYVNNNNKNQDNNNIIKFKVKYYY